MDCVTLRLEGDVGEIFASAVDDALDSRRAVSASTTILPNEGSTSP
jgi:hypothetical protein